MKLLVATKNLGKIKEYRELITNTSIQLINLNQLDQSIQNLKVEETGKSFKQNAIIKAKAYGQKANLLTLADDSGLEVEALNGFPGIFSSRFAKNNYKLANQKIIDRINKINPSNRNAKFSTTIALFNPKTKTIKSFSGVTHGSIALKPAGKTGFGYDPIFYVNDLKKTFGQTTNLEKNLISHRAKALEKLQTHLLNL